MHIDSIGLILPSGVEAGSVATGLLLSVTDNVPRVDVLHAKSQARSVIEALRTPKISPVIEECLAMVERSDLPDWSERPVMSFSPSLSLNIIQTILPIAQGHPEVGSVVIRQGQSSHFCRLNLPIAEPAEDGLLALIDGPAALVYVFRSKAQAREILARHAHLLPLERYAQILAVVDGCERLPEASELPAETVVGHAASMICRACDLENQRKTQAN